MIELKPHTPLDAESEIELRDGTRVLIRAGRPTDEALLEAMIHACSDWSLHHRFFGLARFLSPVEYRCLLGVQDANALSLVGMVNERGREEMVATAVKLAAAMGARGWVERHGIRFVGPNCVGVSAARGMERDVAGCPHRSNGSTRRGGG